MSYKSREHGGKSLFIHLKTEAHFHFVPFDYTIAGFTIPLQCFCFYLLPELLVLDTPPFPNLLPRGGCVKEPSPQDTLKARETADMRGR